MIAEEGGRSCFNCTYWNGTKRKQRAYCKRLHLSGIEAPTGLRVCVLWEKRHNARTPKV